MCKQLQMHGLPVKAAILTQITGNQQAQSVIIIMANLFN